MTASLLSMGFPLSRVHPLVSLLNPSQPNVIEIALELLTREADDDPPEDADDDDEEDDEDEDDHVQHHHSSRSAVPIPTFAGLRHRRHFPPPPPPDEEEEVSEAVGVLRIMTGCTVEEAISALQREADINAAAEFLLSRQEHKDSSPAPLTSAEAEEEERKREQRLQQRRQKRRERVVEYRQQEEEGGKDAKRFLHYGDVLLIQKGLSEGEMLMVDSDTNTVTLAPYAFTPSFSSPSATTRGANAITSPLALPSQGFHTPKDQTALPPSAIPPSLSLSSSPTPSPVGSRSLLSSSPPVKRMAVTSGPGSSSAFFPSSPFHPTPPSSIPPSHPLSSPSSQSTDRPSFRPLSVSPLQSPGKPRSFSTPRKSSHPLSLSLPSHHRYHLTLRPAPHSPTSREEGEEEEEGGLVMSGDRVVLETYERCFLCVEADGSVGCNRTAPLTQQMTFTVKVEEKVDGGSEGADGEEDEDIRAVEVNAVVSLVTADHHYVGLEGRYAVAREAQPSPSQHFTLGLAHKAAPHQRRHRSSASSSSPVQTATAPPLSAASLHWRYLRNNFRLLAMSVLQGAIAEKRVALLQKQRAQLLHREDAKRLCSICLDRVCEVVLLECGHSCACEECAQGLQECVVCRQKVHRVVVIRAACY